MARIPLERAPVEGWAVTSQAPDQLVIDDTGNAVIGTRVTFLTGDGNRGSVFVPEEYYRASVVRDMIDHKAALIDEVGRLVRGVFE